MPELPEVETTKRGITPHVVGAKVTGLIIRQNKLRWPITDNLEKHLFGVKLLRIERRAKYLLLHFETGYLLVHLGMSGSLCIVDTDIQDTQKTVPKHAHVDLHFENDTMLRYTDPRRFGAILWLGSDFTKHPLIAKIGPEPLARDFNPAYLAQKAKGKTRAVKTFIMDQQVVAGVGNIYATEALFRAGIYPEAPVGQVSKDKLTLLCQEIKDILARAINQGGTTLRDFVSGSGTPGYFQQTLLVYGRKGKACRTCGTTLEELRLSNRSSVYCPKCQPRLGS